MARAPEFIQFNPGGGIYEREQVVSDQTFGYIQFWVVGDVGDGTLGPVMNTVFKRERDVNNNPFVVPAKYWWGSPRSEDTMIQEARELCLQFKKLGFTLHANDGAQLRELELTNIWGEGLSTNEKG